MKWRKIKYILFHRSVLAGLALVAQVAVLFCDGQRIYRPF